DVDGGSLTAAVVAGPANGTLALNKDGTFTYTPNANFSGTDSFTYKANDSLADSNVATVTISVGAGNQAPVATDDAFATKEDVVVAGAVLGNDSDAARDNPTAALIDGPDNGTLVLNADGSFTYTPDADFSGMDEFTYQASDGILDSNIATVVITVTPVNDPPLAGDDSATTAEDTPVVIDVLKNDTDADGDTLTVTSATAQTGTVTINPDG